MSTPSAGRGPSARPTGRGGPPPNVASAAALASKRWSPEAARSVVPTASMPPSGSGTSSDTRESATRELPFSLTTPPFREKRDNRRAGPDPSSTQTLPSLPNAAWVGSVATVTTSSSMRAPSGRRRATRTVVDVVTRSNTMSSTPPSASTRSECRPTVAVPAAGKSTIPPAPNVGSRSPAATAAGVPVGSGVATSVAVGDGDGGSVDSDDPLDPPPQLASTTARAARIGNGGERRISRPTAGAAKSFTRRPAANALDSRHRRAAETLSVAT